MVIGAIQPEKLKGLVTDLSTDGLLQRFMIYRPPSARPAGQSVTMTTGRPTGRRSMPTSSWCGALGRCSRRRGGGWADGYLQVWAGAEAQPHRRRLFRLVERIEVDPKLPTRPARDGLRSGGAAGPAGAHLPLHRAAEGRLRTRADTHRERQGRDGGQLHPPGRGALDFSASTASWGSTVIRTPGGWPATSCAPGGAPQRPRYRRACRELRGDQAASSAPWSCWSMPGGCGTSSRKLTKAPKWEVNPATHPLFAERAAAERARRERVQELIRTSIDDLCR